jgi:Tol biopolymer transport system component
MNADGSAITRLTTDPDEDFDPSWSPDGTQIAFRTHRDGDEEVYVMNADGTEQRNLSNASGGDYSPAWSPDGEWIAFMSDRDGRPNIWLIRPDGSDVRQVTNLPGISEYPSWSPDSRRIAFHCTSGRVLPSGVGDFEVCVVNADGSNVIQLTDSPGQSKLPAWSPDGSLIAFQSDREGWPTLPDYVPPGYDPDEFGDYEIYTMNVDGTEQTNISRHPEADDTFPAWSRDGHLIFSRYGCLIVKAADGSGVRQISQGSCAGEDSGFFADWWEGANR